MQTALAPKEHHANLVPWQLLAESTGAVLRCWEAESVGSLSSSLDVDTKKKTKAQHVGNPGRGTSEDPTALAHQILDYSGL